MFSGDLPPLHLAVFYNDNPPCDTLGNIESALKRGLPEASKFYGGLINRPVAIVAGGPSLNLGELAQFKGDIFACGSVHDHLITNGITPQCAVFCDQWPTMADLVKHAGTHVRYLLASYCSPELFDLLKANDVYIWHGLTDNPEYDPTFEEVYGGRQTLPGISAVTIKAWFLALAIGYRDIHFFGWDCSFPENCQTQHAYDMPEEQRSVTYGLTVIESGNHFVTTGGFLAQARAFVEYYKRLAKHDVTIHGDGLVADLFKAYSDNPV